MKRHKLLLWVSFRAAATARTLGSGKSLARRAKRKSSWRPMVAATTWERLKSGF